MVSVQSTSYQEPCLARTMLKVIRMVFLSDDNDQVFLSEQNQMCSVLLQHQLGEPKALHTESL